MNYKILYQGAFSMLEVELEQNESIKAESGAMVTMSENFDIDGKVDGGIGKALARSFLSNEKFFFQKIVATRGSGKSLLAPGVLGDIAAIDLSGEDYIRNHLKKLYFKKKVEQIDIDSNLDKKSLLKARKEIDMLLEILTGDSHDED